MATVTSSKRHLLVTSDTYTSNGDVTVGGDLFVNGSQTIINTTTLNVEDKNITLNYGGTEASSQGAGITIVGSNATFIWDEANTRWSLSDGLVVSGNISASNLSGTNTGDQDLSGYATTGSIPTDFVSKANGGTFSGSLIVGSTSSTANKSLKVLAGDSFIASIEAFGGSQGTGKLYVGQASNYGGGIMYNGDDNPNLPQTSDAISFYRRTADTEAEVFSYPHNSSVVTFVSDIVINGGDITLGGTGRIQGVDTVSAGTDAANKTYVDNAISTATGAYLQLSGGTMSGGINMNGNSLTNVSGISGNNFNISGVNQLSINDPGEGIYFAGTTNVHLYAIDDATDSIMNFSNASELRVNNNKVWTAANDGSGSGLDADLLDGQHGSYYAAASSLGNYLPLAGGTMTGDLLMDGKAGVGNVIGLATGINSNAMSLKLYTYNNIDPGGGLGTSTGNMIQADLGSNLVLRQTASDGDITFQSDDGAGGIATYLTLDGSSTDAYFSNPGNVGIGTTSPIHTLYVAGDIGQTDGSRIWFRGSSSSSTTGAQSYIYSNGLNLQIKGDDNVQILGDGGGLIAHFDYTGNVGIGTTSPGAKLDVAGDIRLNSIGQELQFSNHSVGAYRDGSNRLMISGYGGIRFQAEAVGGMENQATRMVINPSGNVGIGTTSPAVQLELGDNTADEKLRLTGAASGKPLMTFYNTTTKIGQIASSSVGVTVTSLGSGNMSFENGGNTRLVIDNSGNVGIGTTIPSYKLDVDGEGRFGDNGGILLTDDSGTSYVRALNNHLNLRTTRDADDIYFSTGTTTTTKMFIQGDTGNVGIGTTGPSYKLDVDGVIRGEQYLRLRDTAGTNRFSIRAESTYGTIDNGTNTLNYNANNHLFLVGLSEKMRINSSGNVGIGTTNPTSQLGSTKVLDISSTGNGEIILDHTDAGVSSDIGLYSWNRNNDHLAHIKATCDGATDSAFISFHAQPTGGSFSNAASNEKMRIKSNGNVGIGTSTPLYLLDAAGTIRCTSLIQTSQSDKKENIGNIDKSKPKAIPFKEYRYKSDIDSTGRKRYGVLAEDIENDYPELVYVDSNGDKAVNYIDLLVKRVAELEKELEDISLTPGPKGDTGGTGATGSAGANGINGKDGVNGNDHLKNVQSITFNERTGQLEITIEGYKDPFKFNPDK